MEIQGPYAQLAQGSRLGGRRRRVAVLVPPLARQLDRGRHDGDPEEHHRRARARPPEGESSRRTSGAGAHVEASVRRVHGFRLQPGARAAALDGAQVPRERVHLRSSCARGWQSRRASPTSSGPSSPSRAGSGLVFPEEHGGSGLGFVDLTVLMEEMGRAVMPGPFFSTVLLGGLAILEAGSAAQKKEWLPRIAGGQAKSDARLDGAERAAGTPPASPRTAQPRSRRLRPRRAPSSSSRTPTSPTCSWWSRAPRGAARPEDGISLFLVPKGTRGPRA